MFHFIKILALIAILNLIEIESCGVSEIGSTVSAAVPLLALVGGRKKRATVGQVQESLLEFDVMLTEELADEIANMDAQEKEQFIVDISNLNKAVKKEIASVGKTARNKVELLQGLQNKITQDFQGKKWYNRLKSLAGEKITSLLQEMAR